MCGPRYLEDILKFYHQSRTLRSSRDHLRLDEPNFNMKTYGQRAFSAATPRLWNKLPFEIRACSDVNIFKSKLKTFLFKMVYDIQFHHICFFFCFLFFFCLCLMIFLCPFLQCKVLRTAMYKHYINSIIIIIMWCTNDKL